MWDRQRMDNNPFQLSNERLKCNIFVLNQWIVPTLEHFQLKGKAENPENPYGLVMVFPAVLRKDVFNFRDTVMGTVQLIIINYSHYYYWFIIINILIFSLTC